MKSHTQKYGNSDKLKAMQIKLKFHNALCLEERSANVTHKKLSTTVYLSANGVSTHRACTHTPLAWETREIFTRSSCMLAPKNFRSSSMHRGVQKITTVRGYLEKRKTLKLVLSYQHLRHMAIAPLVETQAAHVFQATCHDTVVLEVSLTPKNFQPRT